MSEHTFKTSNAPIVAIAAQETTGFGCDFSTWRVAFKSDGCGCYFRFNGWHTNADRASSETEFYCDPLTLTTILCRAREGGWSELDEFYYDGILDRPGTMLTFDVGGQLKEVRERNGGIRHAKMGLYRELIAAINKLVPNSINESTRHL